MKLPPDLENLVLDYFYSRWVWEQKQRFHREIRHLWLLQEVKLFYCCFYNVHPTADEYYDMVIQNLL